MDQYGSLSTLATYMTKLKVSLAKAKECWKKAYEGVAEACHEFETNQKVLQQKKDDQINALKGLGEEVAIA